MNKKKIQIAEILVLLACFAGWAVLIFGGQLQSFDLSVQQAVFSVRTPFLTSLLAPLEYIAHWPMPAVICLALFFYPKTRFSYGIPLSGITVGSVIIYSILKRVFGRLRPDMALWLVKEHGFSFPSGHSLNNMVFWAALVSLLGYYYQQKGRSLPVYKNHPKDALLYPKSAGPVAVLRIFAVCWVLLIGFSRIYLGVHWPSDVIGAWILGFGILKIGYFVFFYDELQ